MTSPSHTTPFEGHYQSPAPPDDEPTQSVDDTSDDFMPYTAEPSSRRLPWCILFAVVVVVAVAVLVGGGLGVLVVYAAL